MAVIDVHNLTSRRLWCSSHCLACAGSGEGGITYARTVCRRAPPRGAQTRLTKTLATRCPGARQPLLARASTRTLPLTRGLRWVALPRYDTISDTWDAAICVRQGALGARSRNEAPNRVHTNTNERFESRGDADLVGYKRNLISLKLRGASVDGVQSVYGVSSGAPSA
jgi:hypothetical protein